jgi:ribose transport system substrate-binding protein
MEEIMKILALAAGLIAGLGFGAPATAQTKPTIAIIVKDTTSPYWQAVLAGARKAGGELGVNLSESGTQSESDADGQIALLEKAAARNPAAIVIAPAQFAALGKPIDKAAKTSKVIGIESAADTKAMTSLLATDNLKAGRLAAEALAVAITKTYGDTEGNVVVMTARPGVPALEKRRDGFKEVLAAKYRALNLAADKIADGNPATVVSAMKDLVMNTPDLRGVFVSDPVMTAAVGQGVREGKPTDRINIIGFGSDAGLVKSLEKGLIVGLVVEDPFRMGYEGVKTAFAAANGEPVSANVDTGATLITKASMNSARSQELLNPKLQ